MELNVVNTKEAPAVVGPYSQAIVYGGLVFCSGQIGINPETGELVEGTEAQARRVLENLAAVLDAAGSGIDRVVKTTVYLADMEDYQKMNGIYAEYFSQSKPARATVQVAKLPLGALVEIEAIAIIENG